MAYLYIFKLLIILIISKIDLCLKMFILFVNFFSIYYLKSVCLKIITLSILQKNSFFKLL